MARITRIRGIYNADPTQASYYWNLVSTCDPTGCMLCLVRNDGSIAHRVLEIRDGRLYRYPLPEDAAYELGLKTTFDNYLAGVNDH